MNSKVYILIGGCIDDKHIIGVFSSRKRACNVRQWLIENDRYYKNYPEDLNIECWSLNSDNVKYL